MIDKNVVTKAVDEWLQKGDYYLVDVEMTPDDRIVIEIDHADGVWIEDCADLSRHLQETLGEELGDYELEVGVLQKNGQKKQGILKEVSEDGQQFTITTKEKQQVEGKKRPVLMDVDKTFDISDIKYCKYLLAFK